MDAPLKQMDYCVVINDKKLKGSGLYRGDILWVAGTKVAPTKKSDPYLQRVFIACVKVVGGEHLLPSEGNDHKVYIVDPRNTERLSEEEAAALKQQLFDQHDV